VRIAYELKMGIVTPAQTELFLEGSMDAAE
jgi:hypothetical protein